MTRRLFCDNCDRDISNDDNTVQIRLESNLAAMLERRKPLKSHQIDYCIECAKLRMPEVWHKLAAEEEAKE